MCGEGDEESRGWLVVVFAVVRFFVGVVVVGGQNGWFVGGDDVKCVTWCRGFFKCIQSVAHRKDGGIDWVTCA